MQKNITGFNGSAGTAVIMQDMAGIMDGWTLFYPGCQSAGRNRNHFI